MRIAISRFLLIAAVLVPARAVAQSPAPEGRVAIQPWVAQRQASARLHPQAVASAERAGPVVGASLTQAPRRKGLPLMLVGAAGVIVGLIIDEPVVTIVSAGVWGIGLYLYTR